ncbi:phosphatidate cytidylyltransferase [Rhodoferax sp.]|jgi:phosphatidate cytidylyltransferase|uniref:phosphatidate cytidylyltransferase n=1 Tax=Rhodoferax sp. TaxID=50421 RepID=UPI0037839F83
MLKLRVITAVLLLALLLPAVLSQSQTPLGLMTLLLISCGAWEWARLNGCQPVFAVSQGVLFGALGLLVWFSGSLEGSLVGVWVVAGSLWVLAGAWLLRYGQARWAEVALVLRLSGGLLALLLAWAAMMQARGIGINFLFSVLGLVWIADIGAYFFGRRWGGRWFSRRLAPGISPGKTWEGAIGGAACVMLVAVAWTALEPYLAVDSASLFTRLAGVGSGFFVLGVLFLCAMSVVGDLVESLFKRLAGVKDSSALLPGHGGVLDRLDALVPTLPLAMMIVTLGAV